MKGFEAAQFSHDFEYQQAKQSERKAERAKRDQRRGRGGKRHTEE